jgi:hypothetical protein
MPGPSQMALWLCLTTSRPLSHKNLLLKLSRCLAFHSLSTTLCWN